ncbi:MAG TPA: tyrosine-type recombinase/integrase [Chitinophagaceae bacterium]|nr:tyrosine-type recombinase/integrase [Chitinophagaceae bacterium]
MQSAQPSSVREFLDYITFQKRYSQHTVISYQNDLTAFFDFISIQYNNISLREISPAVVRSWLASLKEQAITSKSINRKISTLRSFFKHQLKTGSIGVNPMSSITSLKVNKRLPSFIEQKDMHTLFSYIEFPDTPEGKTERLLLMIFYQTGMRLSELIHIKESHVDKSNGSIKVLGKGNKERIIPVRDKLIHEIYDYIRAKKDFENAPVGPYLLVNKKGKKLYPKYVYNVVKKYLGTVSTSERKSPHVLRHTFATHLTNNGADINAVKELLGHASLASTQIYTHNSIDKLREIYKLAHPKS